jgi:hypothetical protein
VETAKGVLDGEVAAPAQADNVKPIIQTIAALRPGRVTA